MSNAPVQSFDNQLGTPAPRKSGTGKMIVIVLAILGGLGLLCCGGMVGLAYFGMSKGAMQIVSSFKSHPVVVEELGGIDSASFNFSEAMKEKQREPDKDFVAVDVKGSKGSGTIMIEIENGNANEIKVGKLRLKDGREIELIDAEPSFEVPGENLQ